MLLWFYCLPLYVVLLFIFISSVIWAAIYLICEIKSLVRPFRTLSIALLICSLILIVYSTLINRPNNIHELQLIPFKSFVDADAQPEIYRSMLMNVTLFVPLGIALSTTISFIYSVKRAIIVSAATAFVISLSTEILQYAFCIGIFQTDDILCNTFGAFIGTLSLPLGMSLVKKSKK